MSSPVRTIINCKTVLSETNDKLLHISKLVGVEWKCIHTALPTTFDAIYYIYDL